MRKSKSDAEEHATIKEAKTGTSLITSTEEFKVGELFRGGIIEKMVTLKKASSGKKGIYEYRVVFGLTPEQVKKREQTRF